MAPSIHQNDPFERLAVRVAAGEIQIDAAQMAVANRLGVLAKALAVWRRPRLLSLAGSLSLAGLFGGSKRRHAPRGLYIHGKVGRGKTMLMDLFYDTATFKPKRRVHFHQFMSETHDAIAAARTTVKGDPIVEVARVFASRFTLLCLDEFHITDIADAMILGRLFTSLFERGVVLVATSNVAPDGLYRNGLNRQLFVPFIDLLGQHLDVMELASARDFRLEKLAGQPLYFVPADDTSRVALRAMFTRLTGVGRGQPMLLDVKGRPLQVPEASSGVAVFKFSDLCEQPLGALDYLHIAQSFHTVIIDGIPQLPKEKRNEARRLTTLIDALYDAHVSVVISADVEPTDIYPAGDAAFLFERTASRLIEMRSEAYLNARAVRSHSAASGHPIDPTTTTY
jgi:cell division protein ZapE